MNKHTALLPKPTNRPGSENNPDLPPFSHPQPFWIVVPHPEDPNSTILLERNSQEEETQSQDKFEILFGPTLDRQSAIGFQRNYAELRGTQQQQQQQQQQQVVSSVADVLPPPDQLSPRGAAIQNPGPPSGPRGDVIGSSGSVLPLIKHADNPHP